MNKFRRFLGRISVETCLKMDYFGTKFFSKVKFDLVRNWAVVGELMSLPVAIISSL